MDTDMDLFFLFHTKGMTDKIKTKFRKSMALINFASFSYFTLALRNAYPDPRMYHLT